MPTIRIAILVTLCVCILACDRTNVNSSNQNRGSAQESNELLSEIAGESAATRSTDPRVLRQRTVKLNREILLARSKSVGVQTTPDNERERAFSMKLFDDAYFVAVVDHFESASPNSKVWSGHLQNIEGTFSIVLDDDGILGTVRVPDRGIFRILTVGDKTVVQELDPTKFKQPVNPIRKSVKAVGPLSPEASLVPDDGSITDILVLYTPAARDAAAIAAGHAAGTTADIEKRVVACTSETNDAYARSLVTTKLNVTYKGLGNYNGDKDGTGSLSTILNDLTTKGDGKLEEAHSLRDTHKADLVMLIVVDNDEGGRANGMDNTNNTATFEKLAFGVVAWDDALDGLLFSHEVGHIQGCDHDRQNTRTRGVYLYSFGYRYVCQSKTYRTIMAYEPGILVPYFSNPAVKYPDACPTGIEEGKVDACEEAKTINNTRVLVANFRRRNP